MHGWSWIVQSAMPERVTFSLIRHLGVWEAQSPAHEVLPGHVGKADRKSSTREEGEMDWNLVLTIALVAVFLGLLVATRGVGGG